MKESLQKHSRAKKRRGRKKRADTFQYNILGLCHKRKYTHNFCLHIAVITICFKIIFSLLLSKLCRYSLFHVLGERSSTGCNLSWRFFSLLKKGILKHPHWTAWLDWPSAGPCSPVNPALWGHCGSSQSQRWGDLGPEEAPQESVGAREVALEQGPGPLNP